MAILSNHLNSYLNFILFSKESYLELYLFLHNMFLRTQFIHIRKDTFIKDVLLFRACNIITTENLLLHYKTFLVL